MTTNYDPIAEQYQRSKLQPWRAHIETFTLLGLLEDLHGKSVLDVACGEGFYTRLLRRRGAERVVGVDISPGMIALARSQEAAAPLGIDYAVGDGKSLSFDEPFDLIFAAYFLNYAHDAQELQTMCASLARCLKPGGRFVTVNCSPHADVYSGRSFRQIRLGRQRAAAAAQRLADHLELLFGEGRDVRYRELLSRSRHSRGSFARRGI